MKRARLRKKDINGSDKYPDARTVGRKFELFLIMSNEIKVGDKVRVREDAPRLYTRWYECDFLHCDSTVKGIELDAAEIERSVGDNGDLYYLTIPLKYLIKVEEEKKEAKFKRGDKVVSKPPFVEKVWTVFGYDDKMPYMVMVGDGEYINERNLEPYTEPTEQTEAEKNDADNLKKVAEEWANTVSDAIKEYGDAACEIIREARTEAYWDAYAADLAKEVALKVANKFNDPKEAADYAVSVAKAVVEGLKRE